MKVWQLKVTWTYANDHWGFRRVTPEDPRQFSFSLLLFKHEKFPCFFEDNAKAFALKMQTKAFPKLKSSDGHSFQTFNFHLPDDYL